jgi:hypothetical protein
MSAGATLERLLALEREQWRQMMLLLQAPLAEQVQ